MQNWKRLVLTVIGFVVLMVTIGAVAINVFGVSSGGVYAGLSAGFGVFIVALVRQWRSRTRGNAE